MAIQSRIEKQEDIKGFLELLKVRGGQVFKGEKSWSQDQVVNFLERLAVNKEALEKVVHHVQIYGQSDSSECLFSNKSLSSGFLLLPGKRKSKNSRDGFTEKHQTLMVAIMCARWPDVKSWISTKAGALGLEQLRSMAIYWVRSREALAQVIGEYRN